MRAVQLMLRLMEIDLEWLAKRADLAIQQLLVELELRWLQFLERTNLT